MQAAAWCGIPPPYRSWAAANLTESVEFAGIPEFSRRARPELLIPAMAG
jgi:hypothetical protein